MNTQSIRILLLILLQAGLLRGASLDGTATPTVIYDHRTFVDGDSIKGYVHFKNGFSAPTGGTITLDIPTEVEGIIRLNGGRIVLLEDVTLASSGQIIGDNTAISGDSASRSRIFGNGHTIHFNSDFRLNTIIWLNDTLPVGDSRVQAGSDNIIYYSSFLSSTVAVNSLKFNGRGHRFTFGPRATIFGQSWFETDGLKNADKTIRIGFRNIQLVDIIAGQGFPLIHFPAGGVSFSSAISNLQLENVVFSVKPGKDLILQGNIEIFNFVRVDRGNLFLFNARTTIKKSSELYVGPETFFWSPSNSPFYFEEAASSKLTLDRCTLNVDPSMTLTGGQVFINGRVLQTGPGYLVLGDNVSSANDVQFIILSGAKYVLTGSAGLIDKNIAF